MVYGDANLQRNLIIPTTPVPTIAFDLDAAEGVIIPLKFTTKWSAKVGLQAEWRIFDPKQRLDEKERELHNKNQLWKGIAMHKIGGVMLHLPMLRSCWRLTNTNALAKIRHCMLKY